MRKMPPWASAMNAFDAGAVPGSVLRGEDYANDFSRSLLAPQRPDPQCIVATAGTLSSKRFNVYRNNVTVSLVDALADIFPAVRRLVGEEFFRAMARIFVLESPPVSPLIFEYGSGFADFIDRFEHTQELPWLGDVARIERAWLDAYHAADVAPMAPAEIAALDPALLPDLRFQPHPASRMVVSAHPALSIFMANHYHDPEGDIELHGPEAALVTRPELDVQVRPLLPGGHVFLGALLAGETLGVAAASGASSSSTFDLAANIEGMLMAGVFSSLLVEPDSCEAKPIGRNT
jgi:hypothetical protein